MTNKTTLRLMQAVIALSVIVTIIGMASLCVSAENMLGCAQP